MDFAPRRVRRISNVIIIAIVAQPSPSHPVIDPTHPITRRSNNRPQERPSAARNRAVRVSGGRVSERHRTPPEISICAGQKSGWGVPPRRETGLYLPPSDLFSRQAKRYARTPRKHWLRRPYADEFPLAIIGLGGIRFACQGASEATISRSRCVSFRQYLALCRANTNCLLR